MHGKAWLLVAAAVAQGCGVRPANSHQSECVASCQAGSPTDATTKALWEALVVNPKRCWSGKQKHLSGTVATKVRVFPDGQTACTATVEDTTGNDEVASCLRTRFDTRVKVTPPSCTDYVMKVHFGDRATDAMAIGADASVARGDVRPNCAGGSAADAAAPTAGGTEWQIALLTELRRVASRAQSCKKPGGPTGLGLVILSIHPSRGVIDVTGEPPFEGTAVGACVADLFRTTCVPPFTGDVRPEIMTFVIE
jgi:hypothetical protein